MRLTVEQTSQIVAILEDAFANNLEDCCDEIITCDCESDTINGFIIIADVTKLSDTLQETVTRVCVPDLQSNTYSEGLLAIQARLSAGGQ